MIIEGSFQGTRTSGVTAVVEMAVSIGTTSE